VDVGLPENVMLVRGSNALTWHGFLTRATWALLVVSLLSAATTTALKAADWPQFLGPTRNNISPEKDLIAAFPATGAKIVWRADVGAGFSGPVVVGGMLILFHRLGDKETVDCLDAKTGKHIWTSDYPTHYQDDFGFDEGPRATPSVVDGNIYTFGAEGMLNCWELATGKNLWRVDTKEQFTAQKGFFGMVCSPLVEGDAVVVNIGGGNGAGIVAFGKADGKVLWKATDEEASYSSPIAATFAGKRYLLVFDRAGLAALDPSTGKLFFQFPWRSRSHASVNAATPLVIDDQVFVSASYGTGAALLRFKESGPETIWSGDDILSNHYATNVYHNGYLYGFDGRQENGPNLRCVELKTGKVRWSKDNFGAGTMMAAGDQLLVLTEKGELILAPASPDDFKPTAHAQILPFESRAYPALADGFYYARAKGKLVCVDLRKQ
jgi:outer membrane protein assembly factor BamB